MIERLNFPTRFELHEARAERREKYARELTPADVGFVRVEILAMKFPFERETSDGKRRLHHDANSFLIPKEDIIIQVGHHKFPRVIGISESWRIDETGIYCTGLIEEREQICASGASLGISYPPDLLIPHDDGTFTVRKARILHLAVVPLGAQACNSARITKIGDSEIRENPPRYSSRWRSSAETFCWE